MGSDLGEPGA